MDEVPIAENRNQVLDEMISWYQRQSQKYSQYPETFQAPDLPSPPLVAQPLTEAINLDQVEAAVKSKESSIGVPQIIHQLAPVKITDTIKLSILSWKQLHPNWYHILWNPLMIDQLLTRFYPSFQRTYTGLPVDQRPAAIRYFVLHRYGGIYSDLSLRPLVAVDTLFRHGQGVYIAQDRLSCFNNQLMGASAQNDFWLDVVTEMDRPYMPWWTCWKTFRRRYQTGNYLLDRVARRWRGSMILLPTHLVCPCSSCDPTPCTQPGSMIEVLSDSRPQSFEERLIGWIECYWSKILIFATIIVLLVIVWWYYQKSVPLK